MRGILLLGCVMIAVALCAPLTGCCDEEEPPIPCMVVPTLDLQATAVAPSAEWFEVNAKAPPFWRGGPVRRFWYRLLGPLPEGCGGGRC